MVVKSRETAGMTRPAGANAGSLEAFVLAREVRRARARTGLRPKQVAALTGIPRNKVDAVELGDIGRPDSRKRPGRLSRSEAVRLLLLPDYGFKSPHVDALLLLAHQSGAVGPEIDHFPLAPEEWTAVRPASSRAQPTETEIREALQALLDAHRADYVRLRGAAASLDAPTPQAPPQEGPDQAGDAASTTKQEWSVPARRCAVFLGREAEMAGLIALLTTTDGPRVILVSGPGGVGKSELVREAVNDESVRRSYDCLRWISGRREEFRKGPDRRRERPPTATEMLRTLAGSLDVDLAGLGRILASASWLVVVDNTETIEDEEELFVRFATISGRSRLVATSRHRYDTGPALLFPEGGLHGLASSASERLVRTEAEARGGSVGGHVESARGLAQVHQLTQGAPLALHWLAAQACRTELPIVVSGLATGNSDDLYDFMFEHSWRELTKPSRDVLDFLAHAVDEPVPAALLDRCGVGLGQLRPAIAEGRSVSFIETSGSDEAYSLHPLASVFVRRRLQRSRWRATSVWKSGLEYLRESLADDTRGAGAALPLGGLQNYLRWMEDAIRDGQPVEGIIAWTKLSRYLWEHWRWDLYGRCEELGRRAVDLLAPGAPDAARMLKALTLCDVAFLDFERGRFSDSIAGSNAALAIFEALGDRIGYALAARYRGLAQFRVKTSQSRRAAAESWRRALAAVRQAQARGYPPPALPTAKAIAELRALGLWDVISGGYQMYRGVLAPSEAQLQRLLGGAHLEDGRLEEAESHFLYAIRTLRSEPGRWAGSEASPMVGLADTYARRGDHQQAALTLTEALEIARTADRRDLEGDVLTALARLDRDRGNVDDALAHARAAEELLVRIGAVADAHEARELIRTLTELGRPHR